MALRKNPTFAPRHDARSKSVNSPTISRALPLPQYLANQGVLTCLLLASSLWLPQTSHFKMYPIVQTSTDRPGPMFLSAITTDPAKTMICDLTGIMVCMLWWTPTLRSWWSTGKATERRERVQETLHVSHCHPSQAECPASSGDIDSDTRQ